MVLVGSSFCLSATTNAQSNIVLRDLSLVQGREIKSFDLQSIKLDDGTQLGWDEVFRATVQPERQAEFDRNIKEIGLPLYRLRQRIAIGDWTRLDQLSDQLMIRYSGVDSQVGKLVCVAAMKGRLETDSRAAAVLPFLIACGKSAELPERSLAAIGLTAKELELGICDQLLPIWYDLQAVERQKLVLVAYSKEQGATLPAGGKVYLASFCIALGQWDEAEEYLRDIADSTETLRQWKALLTAEVQRRKQNAAPTASTFQSDSQTSAAIRAVSAFWEAENQNLSTAAEPAEKILDYLKVSAIWGEQFPNLASASLYRSILLANSSNMTKEAETLAAELLRSHANSYHERLLRTNK